MMGNDALDAYDSGLKLLSKYAEQIETCFKLFENHKELANIYLKETEYYLKKYHELKHALGLDSKEIEDAVNKIYASSESGEEVAIAN